MGAVSGVSCIAVTIFAIISMPLGDKGLSWRKAKESEGVEEWGSGGVGELELELERELELEEEEDRELELEEEAEGDGVGEWGSGGVEE